MDNLILLKDLKERLAFLTSSDDIITHCKKYFCNDYYDRFIKKNRILFNTLFDIIKNISDIKIYKKELKNNLFKTKEEYEIILFNIGYYIKNKKFNLDKSLKYLDLIEDYFKGIFEKGLIYYIKKEYEEAERLFLKALEKLKTSNEINSKLYKTIINYCLGFLYMELGDYYKMFKCYKVKYLKILQYNTNYDLLINCFIFLTFLNLGIYHQFLSKDYILMSYYYDFILDNIEYLYNFDKKLMNYMYQTINFYYGLYYENININNSKNFYNNLLHVKGNNYYSYDVLKRLINLDNEFSLKYNIEFNSSINMNNYSQSFYVIRNFLKHGYIKKAINYLLIIINDISFKSDKAIYIIIYFYLIRFLKDKNSYYNNLYKSFDKSSLFKLFNNKNINFTNIINSIVIVKPILKDYKDYKDYINMLILLNN